MATLAESLVSSTSRPLPLRMRPDLEVRRHRYHGRVYWVVKEPVGLNYFRFHEEEFAILRMLDGRTSMEQIKERFDAQFAPQKLQYRELQQFIGQLHRSGLVISNAPGQGAQLRRRRDEKWRKELLGKLANIFALRFRGVDPERLLNGLLPYTSWFFSPPAILMVLAIAAAAGLLVLVQFDVFRARLPAFHEFFGPHNWFYLAATLAVVKILHEFGHGLSCKRYGGECHEIGLMLLVFTPCLYCNVSDSWMLPSKWQRAFIGAAGMYVELFLASVATFLWWFSEPGLLNQICLSVMFVCSVSTVVFNGNPLLRFDGYYILMDLLEIPNLRQKSSEILRRFLVGLCLGIEQPESPFLPKRRRFLFGLYTVASVVYRWIVVFSILYFLNKVLEPYGLKIVGRLIAIAGFIGLVVQPLYQLVRFFYIPGRMHKVKRHRVVATGLVVLGVLAVILFVPLPYQVRCVFTVQPQGAEPVFARVGGQLVEVLVKPGQTVQQGDLLARIENLELRLDLARVEGEHRRYAAQLEALEQQRIRLRGDDKAASEQVPQLRELLATTETEIEQLRQQLRYTEVRAPVSGIVIAPEPRPAPKHQEGMLPVWSGSPLDPSNRYARISESDLLCRIGDPQALVAELIVDQSVIDRIRPGQKVRLKLYAFPHRTITGRVEKVGEDKLKSVPPGLTREGSGGVETVTDETGQVRPLHPSYPVRVVFDQKHPDFQVGMAGLARVQVDWTPLASRWYRYLARTFHFEL
ncbi:MAG: hemolysin D [Pirellulaceae bacterium]|nr:MAG: hemolysin D [Pirellulaceae bacterium]